MSGLVPFVFYTFFDVSYNSNVNCIIIFKLCCDCKLIDSAIKLSSSMNGVQCLQRGGKLCSCNPSDVLLNTWYIAHCVALENIHTLLTECFLV